jgi:DNA processing protein
MNNDLKYWVGFNCISGIGRVRFAQLEKHFGTMENAWQASSGEMKQAGLDSPALRAISLGRPKISLDDEMAKLEQHHIEAVTCRDERYPSRLKEIYDYPPVLYV